MAGMAYSLKKPIKMSPNSPKNLVQFHLEQVRALLPDHSFNQASPNGCLRPPRLYSAAVDGTGSTSLCPEKVFVTRIPLPTRPTREDADAAVIKFQLNVALNSSSSHHRFCFLGNGPAAVDDGQNYVDPAPNRGFNYIPDLNVSPPNEKGPTTDFVRQIKSQNISRFTDHVVCCLGWSDEEVVEYKKILSSISEAKIGNLDSIRIWNILTMEAEIQKTLVTKGLVEAPVRLDDLEELLPMPKKGRKAVAMASLHLREVRLLTIRDAEVEESSNIGGAGTSRASAAIVAPNAAFSFRGPQTAVYAAVYRGGGGTRLCPEEVLLTDLEVNGPTRQNAMAAIMAFQLKMALILSSSSRQVVDFCFLEPAEGGDQNFVDPAPNRGPNYIPNLNVSPPDATVPATEFIGEIKSQNISRFTDYVVGYLGEYESDDEVAEYRKILSSKSEAEIGKLDSIRIWNILTLRAEIQKALVAKGLVEAPIVSDDVQFPPLQQLLPIPQQSWTAALNHGHIHCPVIAAAAGTGANYNGNDETMLDGRNYGVGYEKRSNLAKRKAVAAGGVDEDNPCCPYDLPMKKPSHGLGGVVWIDEAKALARDKAPIDEAEEEGVSSDSDSSY